LAGVSRLRSPRYPDAYRRFFHRFLRFSRPYLSEENRQKILRFKNRENRKNRDLFAILRPIPFPVRRS